MRNAPVSALSPCFQNPGVVWGQVLLQQAPSASTLILLKVIKEGYDEIFETSPHIVDVPDVADALLMVYEKPEAEGRFSMVHMRISREILKKHSPDCNYSKRTIEEIKERRVPIVTPEKLQRLGWKFRSLEETVIDSVESFKQLGLLSY